MPESSAVGDSESDEPTVSKSAGSSKAKAGRSKSGATPKAKKDAGHQRTSLPTFYRQIVAELRKVVWPTQEELVTYFFVCMAFVLVMIGLVSVLDLGFGKLAFEVFGGHKN